MPAPLDSPPAQGHCGGSGWQGVARTRSAALFGDSHRKGASPPLATYSMTRLPAAIARAPETRPQSEDDPITLADACRLFPSSRLTVSTLRAEAARGRLDIFRLGRRDYVTLAAMREMFRKCQDAARLRASTSTQRASNGLSETDQLKSAQAALNQTVAALRSGLPHISGKSTNRSAARRR
jgi:hypothetical protein